MIRSFSENLMTKIWYLDAPNVDRIMHLMDNIYLARTLRLYHLEEFLFAKLIFLMRSRETLIKYTRRITSQQQQTEPVMRRPSDDDYNDGKLRRLMIENIEDQKESVGSKEILDQISEKSTESIKGTAEATLSRTSKESQITKSNESQIPGGSRENTESNVTKSAQPEIPGGSTENTESNATESIQSEIPGGSRENTQGTEAEFPGGSRENAESNATESAQSEIPEGSRENTKRRFESAHSQISERSRESTDSSTFQSAQSYISERSRDSNESQAFQSARSQISEEPREDDEDNPDTGAS